MVFDSLSYLIFLSIVLVVFYSIPHKTRWLWLLLSSCYFYMALIPIYILLLFLIITTDYFVGLMLDSPKAQYRRLILCLSLLSNIGTLFIFKYFNFFSTTIHSLLASFNIVIPVFHMNWLLPLGLSFHTFQSMSYTLEVYYGRQKAIRHLGKVACYVMFFPQLVAGPIERPQHFFPQLFSEKYLNLGNLTVGSRRILYGLFKKMIVADNLGGFVDAIFMGQAPNHPFYSFFAIIGFSIQIYMDFSGYCDIALGSARLFGFDLSENFRSPYSATSISEFWKRWHITLSQWFRDYLYIPLGGNRTSLSKQQLNILIVFLISGLWHGASWTYVLWGFLHGIALVIENLFRHFKKLAVPRTDNRIGGSLAKIFAWCFTTSFVCLAWTYFRAPSIEIGNKILLGLFNFPGTQFQLYDGYFPSRYVLGLFFGLVVLFIEASPAGAQVKQFFFNKVPVVARITVYASVTVAVLNLSIVALKPFIYFQF